jgi:hypothetical protein
VVALFDVTLIFCDEPENVTVEPAGSSLAVWEKPAVLEDLIKSPDRVIFFVPRFKVAFPVISRSQSKLKVAPTVNVIAEDPFPTLTMLPDPETVQPEGLALVVGVALF